MTALAADKAYISRKREDRATRLDGTALAASVFYNGAMVMRNAAGKLVPATDTTALVFAGIWDQEAYTVGAADEDLSVLVGQIEWIAQDGNITQAMVGKVAVVLDDQTLTNDTTASAVAPVKVGSIISLETRHGVAGVWTWTGVTDGRLIAP